MSHLKISDFKMFDRAPYEHIDANIFTKIIVHGIQEEASMYGPVFTTRMIKYTLQFMTQKLGEKPPEDIKTLDQLAEYTISKADKYPTPYCAISYGQIRTENELQGQTGAGTRLELRNIVKGVRKRVEAEDDKELDASTLLLRQESVEKIGDEIHINLDYILSEILDTPRD